MSDDTQNDQEQPTSPWKEITQPFVDLIKAPRALWGINLGYLIEGMVYFGILGYLAMYFNDYIGLDDVWAGRMVGVLTAGITISMFFLGSVADKKGVRFALLLAFVLMLFGRVLLGGAPLVDASHVQITAEEAMSNDPVFTIGATQPLAVRDTAAAAAEGAPDTITSDSPGWGSSAHILALIGILIIVVGYGLYQPAAYAAVRQFTTPKTSAMGFAMLYALMNLGGWIPTFAMFLRNDEVELNLAFTDIKATGAGLGILGTTWIYGACTVVALLSTWLLLSRATVAKAIADAKAAREKEKDDDEKKEDAAEAEPEAPRGEGILGWLKHYLSTHPLRDAKFSFFIFCLIPVQTLFAHNWLTLPQYVERGFKETWPWISQNFEPAVNFNPLLIFIFVPVFTALTRKKNVYNMMIWGTFVMAAPTFLLAIGPYPWALVSFIVIMTVGEALWQPRFLQYAAEIAPEGRTGAYMGVAQLPWFLTKVIVPLYSGWFLGRYLPEDGPGHSETMWLIYGFIAISSTVMLILARGWLGKDFKTKA